MSIYFLQDFEKFPHVIVDTKTKNKSFLELASKYRAMGIKNYFFHLALLQPELQGVDPHDPDLPMELQVKWAIECRLNPWAYFREVFRLPTQGSGAPDPLRANRGNIGAYWSYFNHVDSCLVQPRQTGKSVGADGINTYVSQVAGRNATFSLITKDHDLRAKNIQRLKDMRDLLPDYLNPYQPRIDTNNPFGISVKLLGNKVSTGVAQSSESAALNLGRGSTSESNQIDEGPFCKNIHVTIPAFLSSGNAARANAARNGSFYGNIFTTTAGKLDTVEGKYMYNMFMGGMMFDEKKLFDLKNTAEVHRMVEMQSKGTKPLVYICLSHRQLGLTDEQLYKLMAESNSVGDEADRDYMNRWTTGSLRSPLSQKSLETITNSKETASHVEITDRMYAINWYIPEDQIAERLANGKFVLGNDTSEMVGKDSVTMYLTDARSLETIFTVDIAESNVYSFIEWFASLMVKYENIVAIPERKSMGVVAIDTLIVKLIALNINPFKRIYNTVIEDGLHLTDDEFRFIHREPIHWPSNVADKYKTKFGYGTAGAGRHKRENLYKETLLRAVDLCAPNLKDDTLCTQLTQLVTKNGRIDHAAGGHDDMVIAWLLAMWFLLHSKNLDYYGIIGPASIALAQQTERKEAHIAQGWERVQYDENKEVIERLKMLIRQLDDCDDFIRAEILETKIQHLSKRVVDETIDSNTIGDLIANAREARERRLTQRRLVI
ncbi:MAG: hypothetical protein [Bacteriophage sp.]|nr:MAG: hypothetical protein [Bacteriophage sp.]